MDKVSVNTDSWFNRGGEKKSDVSVDSLFDALVLMNDRFRTADAALAATYKMTPIGYIDQSIFLAGERIHMWTLSKYIFNMPGDLSGLVDQKLETSLVNGPVAALLRVRASQITTSVDPTDGGGPLGNPDLGPGPAGGPSFWTFDDFIGSNSTHTAVEGFDLVFQDLCHQWGVEFCQVEDIDAYADALVHAGDPDKPVRHFISQALDLTGLWEIIVGIVGQDPLTGDEYDGWGRFAEIVSGVLLILGYLAIPFTMGESAEGALAARELLVNLAKMALLNALAAAGSQLTSRVAEELGLPPQVCTLIAAGAAVAIYMTGGRWVYTATLPGGTVLPERSLDLPVTIRTEVVPEGTVFTAEESALVRQATPRDVDGNLLDCHGDPLADDAVIRWDPVNNRYVLENPKPVPAGDAPPVDTAPETTPGGEPGIDPQPTRVPGDEPNPGFRGPVDVGPGETGPVRVETPESPPGSVVTDGGGPTVAEQPKLGVKGVVDSGDPVNYPRPKVTDPANIHDVPAGDVKVNDVFSARADLEPNSVYHVEGRGEFYTNGDGKVTYVKTTWADDPKLPNPELMKAQPGCTYVVTPRITDPVPGFNYDQVFVVSDDGLVVSFFTEHIAQGDSVRNLTIQKMAGGPDGDFEGGHTVSRNNAGGFETINLTEQFWGVNRGAGWSFNSQDAFYETINGLDPNALTNIRVTADFPPGAKPVETTYHPTGGESYDVNYNPRPDSYTIKYDLYGKEQELTVENTEEGWANAVEKLKQQLQDQLEQVQQVNGG